MNINYSVLMSLYIKEKPEFLIKSIESMLNQTVRSNQIIIVLDGKLNSKLYEIINYYEKKLPNLFTIVPLENNIGLGLALNEGIKQSKNELIARMDTDDISYPERCEKQLIEFSKNPELDIVGTLNSEFYDSPEKIVSVREVPENHEEIVEFSKRRSPFNHPTVMYRKSKVESVGGYRDILRKEDIDLFVRMLINGNKGKNIQQQLLYFRSNEDNFKRRKSWTNNWNYVKIIYIFWTKGHSSLWDLIYVFLTQMGMFLAPVSLLKFVSNSVLRKKNVEN